MALQLRAPYRPKKSSNRYCGPAVVSILTGVDTEEIARVMRHVSGKKKIIGTHWNVVVKTFRLYGIEVGTQKYARDHNTGNKPTLAAWLKQVDRPAGKIYFVNAGWHWQLISGRRYACGRIGDVVSIKDKRVKRRARVTSYAEVTQYRKLGLDPEIRKVFDAEDERKRENARRYNRRMKGAPTAKKMMEVLQAAGITVEYDPLYDYEGTISRYWVYPTDEWTAKYGDDPWEEAHNFYGREGLWEAYQVYTEHMNQGA